MKAKRVDFPLLSVADVRGLEQELFTRQDSYAVMQTAAQAIYTQIIKDFPRQKLMSLTVHIVLGAGNNAGDGLVLAGLLQQAGYRVVAYRVFDNHFKGDAEKAEHFALTTGVKIMPFSPFTCGTEDVIVEAIFGIGLDRPIEGKAKLAVEHINQCKQNHPHITVYAVDIPAGIESDSGNALGVAVVADKTVTFIADKIGLHTADGKGCVGVVRVADLGAKPLPSSVYRYDYAECLPINTENTHKGDYGHTLIIGGGQGMFGATALSAISALKVGTGKSSIYSHADYQSQYHIDGTALYEVMRCLRLDDLSAYSTLIVGPGLGRDAWGRDVFKQTARRVGDNQSLLIDADGLYHLADMPDLFQGRLNIITPHEGEAARLLQTTVAAIRADKLSAVRQLAKRYQCIAVLKGAGTLISDGRQVGINSTGNIQLATAGSGDVLAGMIGGYMARGLSPFDAACYGVHRHGLAADNYLQQHQDKSMRASDLWGYL